MDKIVIEGKQKFLGIEIPIIAGGFGEGKRCILAKDIAKLHGVELKVINQAINRNLDEFEKGVDILELLSVTDYHREIYEKLGYNFDELYKNKNIYLLSESGYMKLASKTQISNKLYSSIMMDIFKNNYIYYMNYSRKEIEFIDQLEASLKPFNINGIRQYSILSYRIDYYIPSLNIVIEYDENDHKDYAYEQHEGRQKEIEQELGCRFIRVSDKNSNEYNIGYVIKNMFNI